MEEKTGWIVSGLPSNKEEVLNVSLPARIMDRSHRVEIDGKGATVYATELEALLVMDFLYLQKTGNEYKVESYPHI